MAAETIMWEDASGNKHKYWIYDFGYDSFAAVPANYIFAKETSPQYYKPIYIGQTGNISDRFDNHHKMDCIKRNGATHIHAHKSSSDEETRCEEESDLIEKWHPICND